MTFETYQRQTRIKKHNQFTGGFWWHGVITFVQSSWVTSCIRSLLGQPDGYSAITMIMTTSSNWAVGVFTGYGHVKSYPSTRSFRSVTFYGSLVMSCNTAQAGWLRGKVELDEKSGYSHGSTFSHNRHRHAWAGYIIHNDKCKQEFKKI